MDRREATELLEWAAARNPGPWREHSLGVARAAETIARELGLDGDRAYVLGLLHDIGRFEGVRGMHHAIAGYDLLAARGEADAARICVTHSFPTRDVRHYSGTRDVTEGELERIRRILERPFDDYDRIVQLCDAISWGEGVCLMEKRLVDVVRRHGAFEGMREKWNEWFGIKEDFERRMGRSLYSLFPECVPNTLGWDPPPDRVR